MAFTGQAPPMVAELDDLEDPSVVRERFTAPDGGDAGPPRLSHDQGGLAAA